MLVDILPIDAQNFKSLRTILWFNTNGCFVQFANLLEYAVLRKYWMKK